METFRPSPLVPISPEDFSIQVIRQSLLVTTQIPQGLMHSVNLCGDKQRHTDDTIFCTQAMQSKEKSWISLLLQRLTLFRPLIVTSGTDS